MTELSLDDIRKRIDAIDVEVQRLISERARCAMDVAKVKQASGEAVFYRPEREADVLNRVKARNDGSLPDNEMARLFREIMSACLALEQPMSIAFLGPEGTYTHAAALKHFGGSVNTVALAAIDEVFREVESGAAHYGVVPVENSTEGMVNHTLDMFLRSPLQICGEVEMRIHHHLLSKEQNVGDIKKIYSHQQSLAQCREWLSAHMSGVELHSVRSNGEAARLASSEDGAAAIAGEAAAQMYGLRSLVANIEDEPENTTRFLVIGHQRTGASRKDKTSLLLSAHNRPGALYSLLEPFKQFGISMTRIESRPSKKGMWDYVFFVDIEGHQDDAVIRQALTAIEKEAAMLKVLGSYPQVVF